MEFYNVLTKSEVADVQVPCTGDADQGNRGAGIVVDTIHKLFLFTDPSYACDGSRDGALVVYGEKDRLIESISGFNFSIAEPTPAIDQSMRRGWAFGPQFSQLQQFFY